MAELPVEVVEYIFHYLISLEDRKSASLVCLQWYRAYQKAYFRTMEVVRMTTDIQFKRFSKMENYHRKYIHFVMKNIEITEGSLPFWEARGQHMKTLVLNGCFIREHMLVQALSFCTNLQLLAIQDCKELFMSGLILERDEERNKLRYAWQHLKTLDLSYNRYLSDSILVKLLRLAPSVNSLILTGCQISFHNGMFRKFYPNGFQYPSESVTTFQLILHYLKANFGYLKHLSLSETLIDNNSLYNLALTENMALKGLELRGCTQISNDGLMQMCTTENLEHLTELDLGLCPRITDISFIALCTSLRQLKKFSVQGCRAITDMGLTSISLLGKIENLNLAECESINGEGLLKGLCHKINYTLREIRLSHMASLTEAAVKGLVEGLPNLRHLDLAFCYNAVTDVSLQTIFRHGERLLSLNIAMCDRITDSGLTGMGMSDRPIVSTVDQPLRMSLGSRHEIAILRDAKIKNEVRELCESEMLVSSNSGLNLSSLRGLQNLVISGCNRVTDVSLKYAFRLNELRILDMSHCQQVTQEGLTHLVRQCTAIEDLNLDMCHNINNEAVKIVVRNLKRLWSLSLGSAQVTNDVLAEIQLAERLAHIDLRHCNKVRGPEESQVHLFQTMPSLRTILYPELPPLAVVAAPTPPAFGLWLRRV